MLRRITLFIPALLGLLGAVDVGGHDQPRRVLRAALYPYVPDDASLYWSLEREFEAANPETDLQLVNLGANYYGGELLDALTTGRVDVAEIDTVFLQDLIDRKLIAEIPPELHWEDGVYLSVAAGAATQGGKIWGVPHWVCGNFLFFRSDDPEASRFRHIDSLDDLEQALGRVASSRQGLGVDLRGKSTLGEKYLDALLDEYQDPAKALKHVDPASPDKAALRALDRLFWLCPGGFCDSDKHHEFGQFYGRQFSRLRSRVLVGYSEQLWAVVDEYLHGVPDGEGAVGRISFEWNNALNAYEPVGARDIDAVALPLSDRGSQMLAWVDVLALRSQLPEETRADAIALIRLASSEEFNLGSLVPAYGSAPRYLLPARASIYRNSRVLRAAPLYATFESIMRNAAAVTGSGLNDKLRAIGKEIEKNGFKPLRE